MKIGITHKLFCAILVTNVLAVFAFALAVQMSVDRGFRAFVQEREEHRLDAVARRAANAYRDRGSWEFATRDASAWTAIAQRPEDYSAPVPRRSLPPALVAEAASDAGSASVDAALVRARPPLGPPGGSDRPQRPDPPATEAGDDHRPVPILPTLLDAEHRVLAGPATSTIGDFERPIIVGGATVGWVALPSAPLEPADRRFLREQLAASWIIAGLAVLLAAAAAVLLARGLLAPIRKLARATHRLATGTYTERIAATASDELGQLVRDFNALAEKLESAERQRRDFLADISHELRTPLAILQGELEALHDGVRTLSRDAVASLQMEVAALNRLIDDLYGLAQADLDDIHYAMQPLALDELLLAAVRAFRDRMQAAGLRLDAPGALPQTTVRGDRERLTQLLNNVLENCIRYTDPGGSVRVRMRAESDKVHIDVEDSKPGVAEAELPRLFERLYRVERSRNREHGGSGLGLSLARAIVERHGGTIEARPSTLGGLWLHISLPQTQ